LRAVTSSLDLFDLTGRVAVVTGGGGLLGEQHAEALAGAGAAVVLADLDHARAAGVAAGVSSRTGAAVSAIAVDVADESSVEQLRAAVLERHGRIDILVNNAANNPQVTREGLRSERLEQLSLDRWNADIAVGLTGAFLCSRVLGAELARNGCGAVVNIASDLAVIAPDQRLYRDPALAEDEQPVKPVSYVVVKTALLGLTRYLATYWADAGVRVNALSPAGVQVEQPDEFVARFSELLPMGRMARRDEYRGALLFLCSDASSFMTGQNLVVDGGRTIW
jgi:NAD(P)-dependent dehydrogenase (short-subunit alcohol dehydrogenase family)